MTTSTCRPSTRAASCSTRQPLEQAPDRDDPERLEGIPELKRNADQGISALGHRGRGGPGRFRQDGQVAGLLRQAAELTGQVRPGIDQPVVDPALAPQADVVKPVQAAEQAVAADLRRLRERLHRSGLREPESALHDQLGSQVGELVEPRRGNADRALGSGDLARRRCLPGPWGRLLVPVGTAAQQDDQPIEVTDEPMQKVVHVRRDAVTRLRQPLFQLMDERGQFLQSHAARRPFERVQAPAQLMDRLARVVPAVEPDHDPLDPLEQLAGIREERLPHLIVEVDSRGQRGNLEPDRDSRVD